MSEPTILDGGVIEASAKEWTLSDYLIEYARTGQLPSEDVIARAVGEGYLFGESNLFTEQGLDFLAEHGVLLRTIYILELGVPVSIPGQDERGKQVNITLKEGSKLLVTFARRHKRTGLIEYYEVSAGAQIPPLLLPPNSKHKFSEHRWPIGLPLVQPQVS